MLNRDIWKTLATRFSVFGLGSIGSILLTRSLGPEGRGFYVGMISIVLVGIQLGTLGLSSSNTYYLSSGKENGRELASNSLTLGLVVGFALGVVGWIAADRIHGLRDGVDIATLVAALATIPMGILLMLGQNFLLAKGQVGAFNRVELVRNLGWMALVVIFAVALNWGHRAAIWLNFLTFTGAALWVWISLEAFGLEPRLRWHYALFRRTFGYGLKAYAVTFFGFLVLRIDALLVQEWRGAVDAGQYGVAVQLGDLILTVSTTVAMITFPKAAERGAAAWPLLRGITLATGAALAACCVIAYALAPWGIRLLFGEAFAPAASAFRILLPGIWCLSIETLLVQYLNGLGMPIVILWCWLGAFAVNIIANAILIPRMGIDGAGWASTFAYALMALLVTGLVIRDRRSRAAEGA